MKTILVGMCGFALAALGADTRLADAAMAGNKAAFESLLKQKAEVNAAQGDGMTALHWAAYRDDLQMVKALLASGADVKAATRDGAITPLFLACANGDAAMIAEMLKAGADAKSVKANGTTALMMAAEAGNPDAVRVLVEHGADVAAKESVHGQTALMFAAAQNRDAVVRYLLAHGADPNVATAVKKLERVRFDQDGNIVEDKAKSLPADAANLNALAKGIGLESAVYAVDAAAGSRMALDVFAKGIGMKDAVFAVDNARKKGGKAGDIGNRAPRKIGPDFMGGMTALLYAAREGHMATAVALVEGGAKVNQVSEGEKMSPLVEAIINGHLDLAKYLLDHGADPNLSTEAGLTALYAAEDVQWVPKAWFPQPSVDQEKTSYLDVMKELIEKGADVNAQIGEKLWFRSFTNDYTWVDTAGATAFWRAAQSSDLPAMKLLVEHGADAKLPNKAGETPLLAAAGIGWAWNWSQRAPYPAVDAVKFCVEHGNDVNAADARGYTALHGAGFLGDNDMVKYLVSKGAKVDAKSKAGDSAADMANGPTRFGQPHAETVALLEQLGSPNSHNCRSDQCVVAAKANIYAERQESVDPKVKAELDAFAKAAGYSEAEYHPESAAPAGGAGRRGGRAQAAAAPKTPADPKQPADAKKGPGN